jgi:hypothetical protein
MSTYGDERHEHDDGIPTHMPLGSWFASSMSTGSRRFGILHEGALSFRDTNSWIIHKADTGKETAWMCTIRSSEKSDRG